MPTLNWIGKDAVVHHEKEVPFRLLKKVKTASVGNNSQNLIIHGDNLEALKALMPFYVGQIKCIYIDPPYNTGNEKWVYNDRVNSPKIKKWLGKVVGKEFEDLCRHDKWLCMMYPRINLLKDLLSEDGAIFVSIDDDEGHYLKAIMDEIFGRENFVTTIIWQKKYAASNDAKYFSDNHDHILCYAKRKNRGSVKNGWIRNLLPRTEKQNKLYKHDSDDGKGRWRSDNLTVKTYSPDYDYPIINPNTAKEYLPTKGRCWSTNKTTMQKWINENRVFFGKDGKGAPQLKRYLREVQDGIVPMTIWLHEDVGHTDEARKELKVLFSEDKLPFDNPKPTRLIKQIMRLTTIDRDIVLDSFAGSGTTGHATLDLNKEDGGNRKFILVEMEDKVAKDITAERVNRAIKKYHYKDGFEYCELSNPLFDKDGQIENLCGFNQLATYIYFTETQTNIDTAKISANFIGDYCETDYYLIYNERGVNILNKIFLKKLKKNNNKKIVYADKCLLDEDTLQKNNIIFKQIPYEVKIY